MPNLKVKGTLTFCKLSKEEEGENRVTIKSKNIFTDFAPVIEYAKETGIDIEDLITEDEDGQGGHLNAKSGYRPKLYIAENGMMKPTNKCNDSCIVELKVKPYDWEYKRKSGTSLGLQAILVREYHESKYNDGDFFELQVDDTDTLPF